MGAEKKGEGKGKAGTNEDQQKSKEEEDQKIVLKVDMHCEACTRKVVRSLNGFAGVEEVTTDRKASTVLVKAAKAVDPLKVCERVQKKSGRKVDILSPLPPPKEENNPKEESKDKKEAMPAEDPPNKDEPPPVITLVLQVAMHCEACAQGLQKHIRKMQGVESVETDVANDRVTVKGVIENPDHLVQLIHKRTRKQAFIVKEEEKPKPKQQDQKPADQEAQKKQDDDKKGEEGNKAEDDDKNINNQQFTRFEHWPTKTYMEYYYTNYAPQLFSDENPNACSVM